MLLLYHSRTVVGQEKPELILKPSWHVSCVTGDRCAELPCAPLYIRIRVDSQTRQSGDQSLPFLRLFQELGVIRLSLGRRLVNLSPVAQRTMPSHFLSYGIARTRVTIQLTSLTLWTRGSHLLTALHCISRASLCVVVL